MSTFLPRFVGRAEAQIYDFPWCRCYWLCRPGLVDAEHLLLVEAHMPAGEAHQFHFHPLMEELIYILSGRAEQWIERESRLLAPGEMAHIPRGTIHATYNTESEELRFLAILSPAKIEGPAVIDVFRDEPWRSLKTPLEYPAEYQRWPAAADLVRWEDRYAHGETPWDCGHASGELTRVLDERRVTPGRAIELGCGTGANAVLLAERGFTVSAVDISQTALALARVRALQVGVSVNFIEADVTTLACNEPFDFVFDRGCYHSVRRENLGGYLSTLGRLTRPGAQILVLAGNDDEAAEECGMPRASAAEITAELGKVGSVQALRAFRFDEAGPDEGPLGWSCLVERR